VCFWRLASTWAGIEESTTHIANSKVNNTPLDLKPEGNSSDNRTELKNQVAVKDDAAETVGVGV